MNESPVHFPLKEYLDRGISASQAIELLKQNDCLTFPQLRSGLFPAANFDNPEVDQTGMSDAWLRDSACIGLVLLGSDQKSAAIKAARGILSRLHVISKRFETIIASGVAPEDDTQRPPVRFVNQDSEPQYDWANAQNDALGYSLQLIGQAAKTGALELHNDDKDLISMVVSYLDAVKYWEDPDSGHWEEIKKVNGSSIGTVIAGLRAIEGIIMDTTKVTTLVQKGQEALASILPFESKTSGAERLYDSALIFLVEPQQVVSDEMAARIIAESEEHLMGEYGFRRYVGDSYWAANYREHFRLGDRTADFSKPENMALRNSYLTAQGEAQWTLIDPMVSMYYAHQYQKTGNSEDANKAGHFIARALNTVVTHQKKDGEIVWRIPELFFLENDVWVPNDHIGLLWGQANLLQGLLAYQEVFGDALIQAEA